MGVQEEGEVGFENHGMRENPGKRIRAAGLEFKEHDEASVSLLLQDGDSEMESSKILMRRRSKRSRKSFPLRREKLSEARVGDSSELVSLVSEETNDGDVAFCLMLLSRDRWKNETEMVKNRQDVNCHGDEDEVENKNEKEEFFASDSDDGTEVTSNNGKKEKRVRGKHRCETCNKQFRSYQELGGHRARHKKAGLDSREVDRVVKQEEYGKLGSCINKVHECPFCYSAFASGQALGGHKRAHAGNTNYFMGMMTRTAKMAQSCAIPEINLNLPTPAYIGSPR